MANFPFFFQVQECDYNTGLHKVSILDFMASGLLLWGGV